VEDLRRHTNITAHGFSEARQAEYTEWFWEVLASLAVAEQQNFLRFVTSCPRPPLLGFGSLKPPLGIQLLGANGDSMLPMAGTCYNLLKLPVYSTKELLRQKLLMAITSGTGFEMS
jgi:ubiquitin-protein ligase E3 C